MEHLQAVLPYDRARSQSRHHSEYGTWSTQGLVSSPDILLDLERESPILVVAFAGLAGEFGGVPSFEFMRTLSAFDTKLVFIRDSQSLWYHGGVRGAGSSVAELARYLATLIDAPAVDRVVFMGASAGGYAAILLSMLVPSHRALAFGPQTFLDLKRRASVGDERWPKPTRRAMPKLDPGYLDLRPIVIRGPGSTRRPDVEIHCAASEELDVLHARHLAGAPATRLVLHELEGPAHNLPGRLKDEGRLRAIVSDALFDPDWPGSG